MTTAEEQKATIIPCFLCSFFVLDRLSEHKAYLYPRQNTNIMCGKSLKPVTKYFSVSKSLCNRVFSQVTRWQFDTISNSQKYPVLLDYLSWSCLADAFYSMLFWPRWAAPKQSGCCTNETTLLECVFVLSDCTCKPMLGTHSEVPPLVNPSLCNPHTVRTEPRTFICVISLS